MAVKLYRCKNLWVKTPGHPCWRVQKALDEQGIEYEVVPGPWPGRGQRGEIEQLSGQTKYPVIQFEWESAWIAPRRSPVRGRLAPLRKARKTALSPGSRKRTVGALGASEGNRDRSNADRMLGECWGRRLAGLCCPARNGHFVSCRLFQASRPWPTRTPLSRKPAPRPGLDADSPCGWRAADSLPEDRLAEELGLAATDE